MEEEGRKEEGRDERRDRRSHGVMEGGREG